MSTDKSNDGLERAVAVKTGAGLYLWKLIARPGTRSNPNGEPLPMSLMLLGNVGDELWWFCTSEESWANQTGSAGWALVRDGTLVAREITVKS